MIAKSDLDPFEAIAVEPRDGLRIWLRYADGTEGELDLSHLAGKGVFAPWRDRAFFEQVHISECGAIAWNDELDLCPDALYLRLTGKSPEDIFPELRNLPESSRPPDSGGVGSASAASHGSRASNPIRPLAVEARDGFRIWLRYADGVEGEVDLSALVGRGVFAAWEEPGFFQKVHISDFGAIAWSDEIDMCPDALYLEITGKSPEDIWPGLKPVQVHA